MEKRPKTQKLPVVKKRRRWLRWTIFLTLTGLVLVTVGVVGLVLYYASDPELPSIHRVGDYHFKVVTKIMSADGELIGEIFEERRTVVPRDKIPPVMIHAIVDAEDADFYEHSGLSYWGMIKALVQDLKPGAHMRGASTLTQQLVRNLLLHNNARTMKRKVQEMILARRLETALSKDEILYMYLNQIEFPYQRFGVEEAARFYFGKSIADVNAGEAALLASLPKGPSEIDPWKHPERAKDRQRYVLSQMVRYKHLKPEEAQKFAAAPIQLVRSPSPFLGIAPEFVSEVKRVLAERIGLKNLATLGLTVTTTCDTRIQKLAREAVERQLQALDERHGYRKPSAHLNPAQMAAHAKKLAKEMPDGPTMDKIVDGVIAAVKVTPKHDGDGAVIDLGAKAGWLPLPMSADRYNPKALAADKRFAVGDVVRVRVIDMQPVEGFGDERMNAAPMNGPAPAPAPTAKPANPPAKPKAIILASAAEPPRDARVPILALELGPQAAAVVIDPNTREVKALVGGYGYRAGAFDRAIAAKRQPGSAFKPFLYATAFSTEKWTPASVLVDGPQVYTSPGMQPWKPSNAEKEEYLGPVRLRVALARSLNTVASQLVDVQRGGVDPAMVVDLAHQAGIESELAPNPSLALGTSEVTPIELTNAYATFASGGRRMFPQLIKAVGNEAETPAAQNAAQAIKPELAYLITSMLTSVIEEGTAASARGKLKRPAAGKTGTTNSHKDAWFVGFTPDLVTGVWVGFDDMRELGHGEQGARAALPMWVEIMQVALKGVPPTPFTQPPGIVVQKIDPKTGLLAAPGAPAIEEVFLEGTAPTQVAPAAGEANPDTFITDQ
ncbi:MAG TPA: PBP1A family penicillin-binding protein, partial [Polyangia bacterium]|nr:PBP1A family penicillin-binding protein [Polyangia bacterium]